MKNYSTRFITGICIVVIGALLLLNNVHLFDFGDLFRTWWPLLLIGASILGYLNDRKSYLWAIAVGVFGLLFQLKELGYISVNPWELFWPGVVIFVGVSILLNRSASSVTVDKANRGSATAILGGSDSRSTSGDYKGTRTTAMLGGVKLDLRKATIKKEATIEVFCFWGGVEIIVPRNVIVRNQTSAVLAGVEDKTEQDAPEGAPVLNIVGDVIMGGVEIKN